MPPVGDTPKLARRVFAAAGRLEAPACCGLWRRRRRRRRAALDQAREILLERLHARVARGRDHRRDLHRLAFADEVRDGLVVEHDFAREVTRLAVFAAHQGLTRDRAQDVAEARARLLLLCARERVDDALDGLIGRDRVEGSEHEVTRLGGGQRERDRLEIPHLADHQHVRIFTKRRAKRGGERARVRPTSR